MNGPITYTPDGLPIVGRIPGRQNAWCITGLRAGLGEGGGHGWLLAQQIVHGEACYDTWCLDPRRFTGHANVEFTARKAVEDYQNEFRFHLPHEHRPAGRLAKTTPLYTTLEVAGAEFGVVAGWERAAYFKPAPDFHEEHGFRFNNTFEVVAAEVAGVQNAVGLMEISGFNRVEISGHGVQEWLDGLTCSTVPKRVGKVGLCYLLSEHGNVKAEATLAKLAPDSYWYGSAAAAEFHDMDWLTAHLPKDGSIRLRSLTASHTILVVAGPRSRELLQQVAPRTDWSAAAFPWLSVKNVYLGHFPAVAMSVSYSGELSYELHIANEALLGVYRLLAAAGKACRMVHFGLYATESMRLEKGFRHWKADLVTEFNPFEAGLARFVRLDKEYVGKAALVAMQQGAPRRAFATLVLDSTLAPAHAGDSMMLDGKVVGTVTSAGWGHRVNRNLAMGYLAPELSTPGTQLVVDVLGQCVPAVVVEEAQYDADFSLVRG